MVPLVLDRVGNVFFGNEQSVVDSEATKKVLCRNSEVRSAEKKAKMRKPYDTEKS